ncbi:C4-dicarboxylate TRAP transporter large permease protein DctM [Fundidesulfovibrio magnetotacticus]|uniref:C4-dicarboxylate TRAP transporter large permease protein DctM n=1 Tax=Fundidesulfovibrio magnetotacticus TaxID=2730080 RepID=A0A6V8LZ78_9BACT|nr:TRAP transporter large permease [Fundidesulfovibrio magnetotacticus]GFK95851.1 C4-dicarboxylate TRAP transporter large permease protein DctM [Fundidesulfovibrio magnetotacticus]
MELWVLFGSFLVLMLIGVPIAVVLGVSSLITIVYMDIPPMVVFQRMASGMNSFSLIAIPFFIYAGEIMQYGGISDRLVRLASGMVGHIRGGLGLVNVVASMFFGGISGSAVADASALGTTLIPMMKRKGFGTDYAVSVTVTAATIGLIIPPSHNMIIYSIAAGGTVSVTNMFLGGFVPGVLVGLCLMAAAYLIAVKRNYPREPFPGFAALLASFFGALPGLLTAVIIIGGVLSGIFTATESSAIAVIYAVAVTALGYKSLKWEDFKRATVNATRTTALVLLIIGTAASFGWLLALNQVPAKLYEILRAVSDNPYVIMFIVNAILLFLGTFMDMAPLIIICTPIFLPVMKAVGMDPVQFGIVLMINLGIGLCTPPVGSVLFVGCAVGKIKIEEAMRAIWPFYAAMVVALMAATYIPWITLIVPKYLGK